MASIPVVLNGVFTTAEGSTTGVFQGTMAYADRGPGGGPIIPPPSGPVDPGYGYPEKPVDPGYGVPGPPYPDPPHPAHPIVLPDPPIPPIDPPVDPPTNPPDPRWQWGYVYSLKAWQPVYVPGPTDPTPH